MPTEGMEAQNWSNRIGEERHKDTPFPKGESSNSSFWKLLWDVSPEGQELTLPGMSCGPYVRISLLSGGHQ